MNIFDLSGRRAIATGSGQGGGLALDRALGPARGDLGSKRAER